MKVAVITPLVLEHKEQPEDPFTLFNLAGALVDLGELEKAIPHLKRCLEAALPGATYLPKTFVLLAKVERRLGHLNQGLCHCRDGKKRFPQDAELLFEEGLLLKAHMEPSAARHCFEQILLLPE